MHCTNSHGTVSIMFLKGLPRACFQIWCGSAKPIALACSLHICAERRDYTEMPTCTDMFLIGEASMSHALHADFTASTGVQRCAWWLGVYAMHA